jgi:hypothetical protein
MREAPEDLLDTLLVLRGCSLDAEMRPLELIHVVPSDERGVLLAVFVEETLIGA